MANLFSNSRDDATATVFANGLISQFLPRETVNFSCRSKISMHSRNAAVRVCSTKADDPTASIVRSSTNRHSSTRCLPANTSQGSRSTRSSASIAKLLPANTAESVATASETAPFNTRCRTKAKVSSMSLRISMGNPHFNPANHTSSSRTYSNAFARSIRAAADSSPREAAASARSASLHTAVCADLPLAAQL